MSTTTPNYNLVLPTPFSPADANIWGPMINGDVNFVDTYSFALANNFIGSSQPTIPATSAPANGQFWINNSTSPWTLSVFDGTQWLSIGTINPSTHVWTPSGITIPPNPNVIVTPTSFNYSVTAGAQYIEVQICGGGGGGGGVIARSDIGAGGGGGAGGAAKRLYAVSALTFPITITIGAGGAGGIGSSNTAPTAGGNSTFGSYLTGYGGAGGTNSSSQDSGTTAFGAGGEAANGDINFSGSPGIPGIYVNDLPMGGSGGASIFGGGGAGATGGNVNGGVGRSYGSGGGGATSIGNATNGGAGLTGAVYIIEYFN